MSSMSCQRMITKVSWRFRSVLLRACKRIGSLVLGMEVPHAHLHLVPINAEHELSFANAQSGVPQEEMIALARAISDDLDSVE